MNRLTKAINCILVDGYCLSRQGEDVSLSQSFIILINDHFRNDKYKFNGSKFIIWMEKPRATLSMNLIILLLLSLIKIMYGLW